MMKSLEAVNFLSGTCINLFMVLDHGKSNEDRGFEEAKKHSATEVCTFLSFTEVGNK